MMSTQLSRPVILILGAGAVGLSLAGKLSAVASVFVACRPVHAKAIREHGLIMHGIWGEHVVKNLTCISNQSEMTRKPDFILITSKGTDTGKICDEYSGLLKDTTVVTLQNGIGNEEIISRYAPSTIGGTILTNFSLDVPGEVRIKSESGPIMVGIWKGSDKSVLQKLVDTFQEAGIHAGIGEDIRRIKWEKSFLNIAVNPLCALLSVQVGAMADPGLKEIISGLIHETFAIMAANSITVSWPDAEGYLHHLFSVQIPDFAHVYPSMYYDIRDGKKTEIDILNGYIVAEGERLGIDSPYNRCITDLIRFRQNNPEPSHPAS
jgi:2-dehydropantoate 2-reductase